MRARTANGSGCAPQKLQHRRVQACPSSHAHTRERTGWKPCLNPTCKRAKLGATPSHTHSTLAKQIASTQPCRWLGHSRVVATECLDLVILVGYDDRPRDHLRHRVASVTPSRPCNASPLSRLHVLATFERTLSLLCERNSKNESPHSPVSALLPTRTRSCVSST
jgi:hypothetical protein